MRARELLQESEAAEFDTDLEDLLIAAKANNITEIDVNDLVDQLNAMGHSVTADGLVNSLEGHDGHKHKFIKQVTLNKIMLKSHVLDDNGVKDPRDREADASRIASRTAMKGVKQRQDQIRQQGKDLR